MKTVALCLQTSNHLMTRTTSSAIKILSISSLTINNGTPLICHFHCLFINLKKQRWVHISYSLKPD